MTKKKPLYGLSKGTTYKKARDMNDMDYIDKLNDHEKQWLDKFAREYYQATFSKTEPNKHPDSMKRACYQANNERGRDMWTQMQRLPNDCIDYIADEKPPTVDTRTAAEDSTGPEDHIIAVIDEDAP